jgi:hypothetical protein
MVESFVFGKSTKKIHVHIAACRFDSYDLHSVGGFSSDVAPVAPAACFIRLMPFHLLDNILYSIPGLTGF